MRALCTHVMRYRGGSHPPSFVILGSFLSLSICLVPSEAHTHIRGSVIFEIDPRNKHIDRQIPINYTHLSGHRQRRRNTAAEPRAVHVYRRDAHGGEQVLLPSLRHRFQTNKSFLDIVCMINDRFGPNVGGDCCRSR